MRCKYLLGLLFAAFFSFSSHAQRGLEMSASEILHEIKGLQTVGSALYFAAHPDDENTRLIAYLARKKQLRTGYLALTRGDGGQNLVGTEKGDALGVLRTQELLMARKYDHGEQYFTRAVDFGYSKNPEETFDKWQKEEILKDAVWVIRNLRPDIIITRFPPDERAGHGHHTASAMLAIEAKKAAADPEFRFYDSRDNKAEPWEVRRVVWNTSWWFYRRMGIEVDKDDFPHVDIGEYSPLLGQAFNSIGSRARSQHKSQGFGALIDRGSELEFFEHLSGDSATQSIFEDYDFSWQRFGNYNLSKKAAQKLQALESRFNSDKPEESIPDLIALRKLTSEIDEEHWKVYLQQKIDKIIANCAGLWCEVLVDKYYASRDDSVSFTLNAVKRNDCVVKTRFVNFGEFTYHIEEPTELLHNKYTEVVSRKVKINLNGYGYSSPYWLEKPKKAGMFQIDDAEQIGKAQNRPFETATALFEVNGQNIEIEVPIEYKWRDRVKGEQRRPFEIRPKVAINFDRSVQVVSGGSQAQMKLNLLVNTSNFTGKLRFEAPKGWEIEPKTYEFASKFRGERIPLNFSLTPAKNAQSGQIKAIVEDESNEYTRSLYEIEYDHIPAQVVMPKALCKLVYLDYEANNSHVAYIKGAGDEIPDALSQLGYTVNQLDPEKITLDELKQYPVVVIGVRAYNTVENIKNIHKDLLKYVESGGRVISQYNTSYGLKAEEVAPYGLLPSRDRITDESAPLKILNSRHPIFNSPNKITNEDFENWVQERGLYFPSDFSEKYEALLEGNDPDEESVNGALLVTSYGKGEWVYTGLSFFRELPAGVPGAYRLFINLLEY